MGTAIIIWKMLSQLAQWVIFNLKTWKTWVQDHSKFPEFKISVKSMLSVKTFFATCSHASYIY